MKIKFIAGCLLLLAVIIINSCEDKQVVPAAVPCITDTAKVTYSSDSNSMQAIINVQCATNNTSCHSPGSVSTYDYSNYSGIYQNYQSGLLYLALFGNGTVPKMPLIQQAGWDPCILNKFKAWIDQGCPQ